MAVFIRYTDVVMLLVAIAAVLLTFHKARIPARSLSWWLGSVVLFAGGVMLFDEAFYGGALKTGYAAGEITFALRAIVPNLKIMPANLLKAMPALLLGLAALLWMAVRVIRSRPFLEDPASTTKIRRDAVIGLVLAAGWLGLWGLYAAYTWTAGTGSAGGLFADGGGGAGGGIHVIRFYLPAIGLIALLGAWLLMQLPKWLPGAFLVVVAVGGFASFRSLTAAGAVGPNANGGFPGGLPGQPGGTRLPPGSSVKLPKGFHSAPPASPPGRPANGKPPAGLTPPRRVTTPGVLSPRK
jgi:hypothetical protein